MTNQFSGKRTPVPLSPEKKKSHEFAENSNPKVRNVKVEEILDDKIVREFDERMIIML